MMEYGPGDCEHPDGSFIGKCAICGAMVCDECFRQVHSQIMCNGHESLEDESAWELIGSYADAGILAERRFLLRDQDIPGLEVEPDADTYELYVPVDEKDTAWETLTEEPGGTLHCSECKIEYSSECNLCPACGISSLGT